jgi:hypothetical protein
LKVQANEIADERNYQKTRNEIATNLLQTAADVRAAAELAEQTAEYNGIKATRDNLKSQLEALYKKDDEGTASLEEQA